MYEAHQVVRRFTQMNSAKINEILASSHKQAGWAEAHYGLKSKQILIRQLLITKVTF